MAANSPDTLIETRLKVLNWNIWWRFGPWQERAPAIKATLREIDADIICLEEVWRDDNTNFAAELAQHLGYHHVYATAMPQKGLVMGNAILSRWPITNHASVKLYDQPKLEEHRTAVFAEIDGPRGKLSVFCTHLNWQQHHSHIRQIQVADLARFVDTNHSGVFPAIVCGDFNADPFAEEIRMMTGQTTCPVENIVFHDAWKVGGDGSNGYTWDNTNPYVAEVLEPDRRIDYIFTGWPGPRGAGHIVNCEIAGNKSINGIWPSDHHALLAELRY